jgi:hypothetical protein
VTQKRKVQLLIYIPDVVVKSQSLHQLLTEVHKICISRPDAMHPPIVLRDAAFWYDERLHQVAAWDFLQQHTPPDVLEAFAELYRTDPSVAEPPTWINRKQSR